MVLNRRFPDGRQGQNETRQHRVTGNRGRPFEPVNATVGVIDGRSPPVGIQEPAEPSAICPVFLHLLLDLGHGIGGGAQLDDEVGTERQETSLLFHREPRKARVRNPRPRPATARPRWEARTPVEESNTTPEPSSSAQRATCAPARMLRAPVSPPVGGIIVISPSAVSSIRTPEFSWQKWKNCSRVRSIAGCRRRTKADSVRTAVRGSTATTRATYTVLRDRSTMVWRSSAVDYHVSG